jgi:metallo-beta-lactamase class B
VVLVLVNVGAEGMNMSRVHRETVIRRWARPLEQLRAPAFQIIGNIYYVGNREVSCYLVTSDDGHLLIDTAFANTVPLLLESIQSLGFNATDIWLILHTHGHVDHTGGTRRMVEATGAETALHHGDVEMVEQGTARTGAYYVYGIDSYETFYVDRPLAGGEVFEVGRTSIQVHHTPGHTQGVVTYEMKVPHAGGTVTAALFGGAGQWTFEPADRSQGYPGDIKDYGETLDFLKTLKVDVPLGSHPDHARILEKWIASWKMPQPEDAFLDPECWKAEIEKREQSFRKLVGQSVKDYP